MNALRYLPVEAVADGGCDGTYPSTQNEVDDATRRRPAAAAVVAVAVAVAVAAAAAEAVPARDVLFPSAAALPLDAGLIDLRGEERARVRIMATQCLVNFEFDFLLLHLFLDWSCVIMCRLAMCRCMSAPCIGDVRRHYM